MRIRTPGFATKPGSRYRRRSNNPPPGGRWYVVTQLGLSGHAGTHVEAPFHALETARALAISRLSGFSGRPLFLTSAMSPGPRLSTGIALATPRVEPRNSAPATLSFFASIGTAGPGTMAGTRRIPSRPLWNGSSIRASSYSGSTVPDLVPGDRSLVNHHLLFDRGIPLIESLAHLEEVHQARVYVFAQPLPALDTDAIPLRVLPSRSSLPAPHTSTR